MTYVYASDHPHDASHEEVVAIIGGKAANISVMSHRLGLPVPPAFTLSTEACRDFLASGWPSGLDDEIRDHIGRLEAAVGRSFGDPVDPLLVSVRSGAPVSMPGMMDTILNLGLNDATTDGLAGVSGDRAFADACRDRFTIAYREIVGVHTVPDDPSEQLRGAIEAVFRSWNGERARRYRAHEGIADDLGTGVTVQAMVFGNRGSDSATGVIFTRNPATGENILYGDLMFDAQGEDVVAGTHQTEPIALLDERMPDVAAELRCYAHILERHYADVCDIEFTIEQGRLWMLQTRIGKRSPQAALRIAIEMAEDESFPLSRAEAVQRIVRYLTDPPKAVAEPSIDAPVMATGLAASPGVASGEIVTNPHAAVSVSGSGRPVILVRRETSPDDVHGMATAAGILTATGGLTSHAAVVARGWGIPAVVGAAAVTVEDDAVRIGDTALHVGDVITIDGTTGRIMMGAVAGEQIVVPEAVALLAWAEELQIDVTTETEGTGAMTEREQSSIDNGVQNDALIRVLGIKGFAMPAAMAEAFATSEESMSASLDRLVADGLVGMVGAMFQLTDDGTTVWEQLTAEDQEAWGKDGAAAALDDFVALDQRVKEIVTAWQMREVDGEPILNDHTDLDYDGRVLADFAALAREADAWLVPLEAGLLRLDRYRHRLERAAGQVASGDHQYIASPRLDSYHNIWFELHEDLILLAGRTREDEVAAGRA